MNTLISTKMLSIIIPNWNGAFLLKKHLSSVISATGKNIEIIVVDDCSTDESVDVIKEYSTVRCLKKNTHEGFASTVNFGVNSAEGEIVVLLNTDVEPEIGFLNPLIEHFSDETVFAVGCMDKSVEDGKIALRGNGEIFWRRGFLMHRKGDMDSGKTDWVSGGSGAFRKSIWNALGGMDTIYDPFYWEDIDLSYRARKAGYNTLFEPKSVVRHYHQEGKILSSISRHNISIISFRNQYIFIWKNISDSDLIVAHIIWNPIYLLLSIFRGDITMFLGYIRALFLLPRVLSSRIRSSRKWKVSDKEIIKFNH